MDLIRNDKKVLASVYAIEEIRGGSRLDRRNSQARTAGGPGVETQKGSPAPPVMAASNEKDRGIDLFELPGSFVVPLLKQQLARN
jgi:hypothetical protein